jgi:uncharacterized protein (TIGR02246 family)
MRHLLALAVAGAALLSGCQSPASFDPEDPAVVAVLESHLQTAMEGAARVDAAQVLGFADDDMTFITGDVMLSGLDTIRAGFEDTYSGLASQQQTLLEKRVRVLSPDVALVLATGEGTYADKAGWTSEPVGLAITIVFVRDNGVWRAVHAHQSITN